MNNKYYSKKNFFKSLNWNYSKSIWSRPQIWHIWSIAHFSPPKKDMLELRPPPAYKHVPCWKMAHIAVCYPRLRLGLQFTCNLGHSLFLRPRMKIYYFLIFWDITVFILIFKLNPICMQIIYMEKPQAE